MATSTQPLNYTQLTEYSVSRPLLLTLSRKATGQRYPKGTKVVVDFGHIGEELSRDTWRMRVRFPDGHEVITRAVTWVFTAPAIDELGDGSVCPSVLEDTAEPDGFDSEGSPSWMLVLGVI